MNQHDEFIEKLQRFEEKGEALSKEDLEWLNVMKEATMAGGELRLKEELNGFYEEYKKSKKARIIRMTTLSIAASIFLGSFLFIFNMKNDPNHPIQLKMEESPSFQDSARYDSSVDQNKKNIPNDVDN